MSEINYQAIYEKNRHDWYEMTNNPQKYEALLAGHYSESNHFVYELLQNAEDERADTVVFEYYDNQLVFYHNGRPFDEADVRSIASMLMGTKDRNDAQTIGKFGMGFKSVFKYTSQPEIYSDETAFRIKNYLLPEEIKGGWNYQAVKGKLKYPNTDGKYFFPFSEAEHLTKFVIPFKKRNESGEMEPVSGKDVLQKLKDLPAEILLFLSYIKKLYWIDQTNGKFVMISFETDEADKNLVFCRKTGSGQGKDGKTVKYLKFRKKFNHPEMKGAEVSVAYRINNRAYNINEIPGSDIWVYFPTRDHTQLPFMIHGSFETAVSREKLMTPSQFNNDLFDKLGDLICETMPELRERHLITQSFIRRVLLAAFKDEDENNTIPGLKEKVTDIFASKRMLPDSDGNYYAVNSLSIPVPFELADFAKGTRFVAFNNERDVNFSEYFNWLNYDLHMKLYTLEDWALDIKTHQGEDIKLQENDINKMEKLYDFLQKYEEELYSYRSPYIRNSNNYEQTIRIFIKDAWESLRQAPLIVNAENKLVSSYNGDNLCVYLSSSSDYTDVVKSSIVHPSIAEGYESLLKQDFLIKDFDNFQYVTEKVIKKYIDVQDVINFENPGNFETEYVEDIEQIIDLFKTTRNADTVREFLSQAYIIKIVSDGNKNLFTKPNNVYVPISDEGIDLQVYYEPISVTVHNEDEDEEYDEEYYQPGYDLIDAEFYEKNGISLNDLRQFGVITSPVNDGVRSDSGGPGVEAWKALGEYCPELEVEGLDETLQFIEDYPETDQAKRKSTEIFKLIGKITRKLSGTVRHRKSNPYETQEENLVCRDIKYYYAWVYDKNEKIHEISEMSKYDLNPDLYGPLLQDKSFYNLLGFREDDNDKIEKAYEAVEALDQKSQRIIYNQLAKKYGEGVSQDQGTSKAEDKDSSVFQADDWTSSEFPVSPVKNIDSLKQHVQQQFYCADPVKYEKVWRQIRTSKNSNIAREYVTGMYTNSSNVRICQMCEQPAYTVEATEISNYGIELPQLHLCLCNNCARKYKTLRDKNKESFRLRIKEEIMDFDISDEENNYEIDLNDEISIAFTQTHVAELQEIFNLLDNNEESPDQISDIADTDGNKLNEGIFADFTQTFTESLQTMLNFYKNMNGNSDEANNMIDTQPSDTEDEQWEEKSKKLQTVGTKVYYKKYGEGEVSKVEGEKIYIRFQNGEEKSFILDMILKTGSVTLI